MPWSSENLPDAVSGKNWSDAQVSEFVRTANAILAETGDEGKAIAIAISQVEKRNSADAFDTIDAEYAARKLGLDFDINLLLRGMNVEAEHTKDPMVAAKIAADHLSERLDYYKKLARCVENADSDAFVHFFYTRHMKGGVAGYNDETLMVDDDTIKTMLPSFVGKPVYIEHQDVNPETVHGDACGWVVDSFWNELDGWAWNKIMVSDAAAASLIQNAGWAVSNAYIPVYDNVGGTTHNVPYDRRVIGGEFTHLALVPNPRYEEAKIFTPEEYKIYQEGKRQQLNELKNSNEKKVSPMKLNFFKTKREEVSEIDAETSIELKNGKSVTVAEMIAAVEAANAKPQTVVVNGKEVAVSDLVAAYSAIENGKKAKKNESDEDAEEEMDNSDDSDADDQKENGYDEDGEEKKNSKSNYVDELKNAATKTANTVQVIETDAMRLARGKQRY